MSIAEQKIEINRRLFDVQDKKILNKISQILDEEYATSWSEIPSKIKSQIHKSISELDAGKLISNEEVFTQIEGKWNTKSSGRSPRTKVSKK
jgi:hypothetical protein